jgi:enoyl-CoA hydratase/carnithine racemase
MSSSSKLIDATVSSGVLRLVFHDSTSRNSFSLRAAEELAAHLQGLSSDIESIVFRAEGRVFCSGGNLSDYAAMTEAHEGQKVNRRIKEVIDELSRVPVPTICLVEGDCFGGGVELMSAFDFAYAVPHAMLALWQRKIGLTYGWGGGVRLEKRLGSARLKELTLSARAMTAAEAKCIGLIDGVIAESRLGEEVGRLVEKLRSLPKAPVGAVKSFDFAHAPEVEREAFENLWWGPEHLQALAPKKRQPL